MSCSLRFFGVGTLGMLVGATAVAQIPPGYDVVQVTNDPAREWNAVINNRSQIVYESWLDGTQQGSELFLWEAGKATRLTNDNVRDSQADINDDGVIVWSRYSGPGATAELMVRLPDGTLIQLTDNDTDDIHASLNAHGQVAFARVMASGCRGSLTRDIFLFDGSVIRPITINGVPEGLANQGPALNDNGQIAWTEYDFCLNPWDSHIMLWDKGVTVRLTTVQFEPQVPSINNNQVVAWSHRPPGTDAIDIWEAGVTTRLTDRGILPRLNDAGMVAFTRWHPETETWQQWLHRDGTFWQLSDDPFWNTNSNINTLGEVAWISGPSSRTDIRYLRRFSLGDLNCDGAIDAFDIEPFIVALLDTGRYRSAYPGCDPLLADLNGDRIVDAFDIQPFTTLLIP